MIDLLGTTFALSSSYDTSPHASLRHAYTANLRQARTARLVEKQVEQHRGIEGPRNFSARGSW